MLIAIKKNSIKKIQVYVNSKRKPMAQIKNELMCQYILNAGLFNLNTFAPINHLTVDGKVLSKTACPYGYGIIDNNLRFSYDNNVKAPTFLGAYPVLVRDGKATNDPIPVGLGGYRHRSCIGVKKNGDVVLLCDGTNRSLGAMATMLVNAGCDTAINLDGGASTQGYFDGIGSISSDRIVHNYICIWTEEAKATKPTMNTLKDIPSWAQPTVQKLINKAAISGDGSGLNLSTDMLRVLVILDRAGVI